MKSYLLLFVNFICLETVAQIRLEPIASGLILPVDIEHAYDSRIFVAEKNGRIRIVENGQLNPMPFLDIRDRVRSSESERGLLGIAFHPQFHNNGFFFVNYSDRNGDTQISRFMVSKADPNIADPGSEFKILHIEQPFSNHNGGDLAFGPDGFFYIGLGDGGSRDDPGNRAQDHLSLLGKMLRIDVDSDQPYAIPPTNPFAGTDFTLDEIWALGLRNPWRFSFDQLTGDLWIGDVGQNDQEEINMQPASSSGGENYGWRCYEGLAPYILSDCNASAYVFPVHTFSHVNQNCGGSVTGGYVYRGKRSPGLSGQYIYADYCTGKIWSLHSDGMGSWKNSEVFDGDAREFVTFGEDVDGELYIAAIGSGILYRIIEDQTSGVIPEKSDERIRVIPNPASDFIKWSIDEVSSSVLYIEIIDLAGRVWHGERKSAIYETNGLIAIPHLPPGLFLLFLSTDSDRLIRKFIKS